MYQYRQPYTAPLPPKKSLGGIGWTVLVVGVFAAGWLGMQYALAVNEWEKCGADTGTAITAPFTEGRPTTLQCIVLLLNK